MSRRRVLAIGLLITALLLLVFARPLREAETRLMAAVLPGAPQADGADLNFREFTITLTVLQSVLVMMVPWTALAGAVLFSLRLPVSRVLGALGVLLVVHLVLNVALVSVTAWTLTMWPSGRASLLCQAVMPGFTQLIMVVGVAVGIRLVFGRVPLPEATR